MARTTVAIFLSAAFAITGTVPALATHTATHVNADDKNNPTFPGVGNGIVRSERAGENANENCAAHAAGDKGGGSENLPAQCYFGPGKQP